MCLCRDLVDPRSLPLWENDLLNDRVRILEEEMRRRDFSTKLTENDAQLRLLRSMEKRATRYNMN